MMAYRTYLLEPRDTVTFRDGAGTLGNIMRTLPFPWPSSAAGLLRTRAGLDEHGAFRVPRDKLDELRERIHCRGPLLARLEGEQPSLELFVAAPLDAVWFSQAPPERTLQRFAVRPEQARPDVMTDLGADLGSNLCIVGLDSNAPRSKPTRGPSFWKWAAAEEWLLDPSSGPPVEAEAIGIPALAVEEQSHVAIDPETGTAADGDLFSVEGLRFSVSAQGGLQRFGLIVDASIDGYPEPSRGVVSLGGERRPTFLTPLNRSILPKLPNGLVRTVQRRLRVVLLTPALFGGGYLPKDGTICGAPVVAAVTPRPLVISGWDFATGRPKPSRRAVPAGAVYWVDVPEALDVDAWLERVWMTCISDEPQDRADGFGLAAVGRG